ncbi:MULTISPECIES: hypothetical protein [Gammaproteobacteria]|uniref:hypothetical protein n=1 Tax=Gammaproteobacteria TaxID=1236 RepID=UPI003A8E9514
MSITEKSGLNQTRRNWSSRVKARKKDRQNLSEYGPNAPQFAERLWIPMSKLNFALKLWSPKKTGCVVTEWPESRITPIKEILVVKSCISHWHNSVPWENTGIYQQMMDYIKLHGKVDRMQSREDIETRYKELDQIYNSVLQTHCLRTRQELIKGNFREEGGILVHIGPDGMPYFGGKGHHRLAVAIAAGLERIPAQLGVVHIDGLSALPAYR